MGFFLWRIICYNMSINWQYNKANHISSYVFHLHQFYNKKYFKYAKKTLKSLNNYLYTNSQFIELSNYTFGRPFCLQISALTMFTIIKLHHQSNTISIVCKSKVVKTKILCKNYLYEFSNINHYPKLWYWKKNEFLLG